MNVTILALCLLCTLSQSKGRVTIHDVVGRLFPLLLFVPPGSLPLHFKAAPALKPRRINAGFFCGVRSMFLSRDPELTPRDWRLSPNMQTDYE